ncbi:hypothetical protein EfmAA96_13410 [Enterococcus faecium]|nr:hypothetical protein EfmAA96_13410 [Enterococcus faecium]
MTYTKPPKSISLCLVINVHQETPVAIVAKQLKRGRQTIYNVYNFLKCGGTILEGIIFYNGYFPNKNNNFYFYRNKL